MYEMFTGTPPYTGEESVSIMFQHVEGIMRPPRELNDEIPELLQNIIIKAMSVNPDNRHQSFDELKLQLESLIELLRCTPFRQYTTITAVQWRTFAD